MHGVVRFNIHFANGAMPQFEYMQVQVGVSLLSPITACPGWVFHLRGFEQMLGGVRVKFDS